MGKQNELKYFYLTATALANKIVALIFLYTQKPKVGFAVLTCDEGCRHVVTGWHGPQSYLISHTGFSNPFLFRIGENKARKLGLNFSLVEGCGAEIAPLQFFFFFFFVLPFCVPSPENHSLSQSEPPSIITPLFPPGLIGRVFLQPKELLMEMWGASLNLEWLFICIKWLCVVRIRARGCSSSSNTKAE